MNILNSIPKSITFQNFTKAQPFLDEFQCIYFLVKNGAKFILKNLLELYITTRLENHSLSMKKNYCSEQIS